MAKPYSIDLRERIVNAYHDGMSVVELSEQFNVSRVSIYSYINLFQETGTVAPKIYQPGRKKKLVPYEAEVRQIISEHPDGTFAEFCDKLSPHVSVSTTALCDFLRHLKITRKKKLSLPANNNAKMLSKNVKNGEDSKS
jgi:transposase